MSFAQWLGAGGGVEHFTSGEMSAGYPELDLMAPEAVLGKSFLASFFFFCLFMFFFSSCFPGCLHSFLEQGAACVCVFLFSPVVRCFFNGFWANSGQKNASCLQPGSVAEF